MPILRPAMVLLAAGVALPAPLAAQQESSVYINQIDPSSAASTPRRGIAPTAADRVLQNASTPASTTPTAAPGNLGLDQTTLLANPNAVRGAVAAGSFAGSGAGGLTENVAVVTQFGTANQATLNQTGLGTGNTGTIQQGALNAASSNNVATATVAGSNNATTQIQGGVGSNTSILGVTGSNNTLTSNQVGSGNAYGLSVNGNGNTVKTDQQGTNLSYTLTIDNPNTSGKVITVTQTGTGPVGNVTTSPLLSQANPFISTR